MQIQKLTAAFAALAILPFVAAQSLANLPTCAQPAIESGITHTTCALTDYTCICGSTGFIDGIKSLIQVACSDADQKATLSFANQVCSAAGAALKLDSSSSPSSPSSTAAAPSTPASSAPQAPGNAPSVASNAVTAPTSSYTPPYPSGNGSLSGSANGTNGTTTPFLGAAATTAKAMSMVAVGAAVVLEIGVLVFL